MNSLTLSQLAAIYEDGDNEQGNAVDNYIEEQVIRRTSALYFDKRDDLTYVAYPDTIWPSDWVVVRLEPYQTIDEVIDEIVYEYNYTTAA